MKNALNTLTVISALAAACATTAPDVKSDKVIDDLQSEARANALRCLEAVQSGKQFDGSVIECISGSEALFNATIRKDEYMTTLAIAKDMCGGKTELFPCPEGTTLTVEDKHWAAVGPNESGMAERLCKNSDGHVVQKKTCIVAVEIASERGKTTEALCVKIK